LIVGADALLDLPQWRSPERIFKLAQVAVMDRPDALQRSLPEPWENRLIRIPTPHVEVSSTEIRNRVASRQSIAYMTPHSVERLIRKHRLYEAA
jgi:nicotinate-nucleotide adenylyltransferase